MKFYHKAQVHVSESKTFVQSKIIPAVQIGRERERVPAAVWEINGWDEGLSESVLISSWEEEEGRDWIWPVMSAKRSDPLSIIFLLRASLTLLAISVIFFFWLRFFSSCSVVDRVRVILTLFVRVGSVIFVGFLLSLGLTPSNKKFRVVYLVGNYCIFSKYYKCLLSPLIWMMGLTN